MMKKLDSKKALLVYAAVLTFLVLGTPLLAGVLTSFNPGETISSSAVNGNFSNLQDQIDNICQLPGQIAVAAEVNANGNLVGDPFSCTGATITVEQNVPAGNYQITVAGLDPNDFFIRVSSLSPALEDVFCTVATTSSVSTVRCFDASSGNIVDNPFLITWTRKP